MLFSTLANPNSEKVTVCTSQEGKEKKETLQKEEGDQQVYIKRQTRKREKADVFLKGFLTGLTGKKFAWVSWAIIIRGIGPVMFIARLWNRW